MKLIQLMKALLISLINRVKAYIQPFSAYIARRRTQMPATRYSILSSNTVPQRLDQKRCKPPAGRHRDCAPEIIIGPIGSLDCALQSGPSTVAGQIGWARRPTRGRLEKVWSGRKLHRVGPLVLGDRRPEEHMQIRPLPSGSVCKTGHTTPFLDRECSDAPRSASENLFARCPIYGC